MRTEDLVERLSAQAEPVESGIVARWLGPALVVGGALSFALMSVWLGLRPMSAAMTDPSFWIKAAYSLALGTSGGWMVWRLATPTGRAGRILYAVIAAAVILAVIAAMEVARATSAEMPVLVFGNTWKWCGLRIVTLSLPLTLALMAGLRRLAPTRLTLAGAAAGLAAGGLAAVIYGFYCQETSAVFVVIWYSLGVAASAGLGALIGPRLLRW
ncbi:MAG TPA: DUF1109 domain-containing protein [Caulobacteraceae bacterium]|nr:DUF1109 domain-containing protein [Caulobacteraceae bacterium]